MTILEIGCCGAFCRTCKAFNGGQCKGCKLGYNKGERDISKAKCKIKLCCFKEKGFQTCADCVEFEECDLIQSWFLKGYKYQRYQRSLNYIKENGYEKFLEIAKGWSHAKGKI